MAGIILPFALVFRRELAIEVMAKLVLVAFLVTRFPAESIVVVPVAPKYAE